MTEMFAKMLVAWAALVMVLTMQSQAQYDPLGSDIFTLPDDMRRTSSLDSIIYFDSIADPLGLDPLMRPLDPEHTAEFLDKISGPKYIAPFVPLQEDLRGNWKLDLLGEHAWKSRSAACPEPGCCLWARYTHYGRLHFCGLRQRAGSQRCAQPGSAQYG